MGERQFWHLAHPDSTARNAEWVHGEMETEQVICPVNEGHRRGGKRLTDLSIALRGAGVEDFVWTWHSECLVQDHVLDLFRTNGFTGFDAKPVKAKFKRATEHEPPRLWELIITGWAGMASAESGIKLTDQCHACGDLDYSPCTNAERLIDVSQWDGSDFFMVWPLPKFIFVTDRVARVIRDSRFKGAVLRRARDIEFSQDYGFSPGRLSYWMPQERARELGGAFGID
jgi:hypothetical protein